MANLIDEKTVERVAHLARLHVSKEEIPALAQEIDAILKYIQQIEKLDLSCVEPTLHALDLLCPRKEDLVQTSLPIEEVLKNAPAKEATAFKVPKVIES